MERDTVPFTAYRTDEIDAIVAAAKKAVWGHSVVISNGGTGWQRHVEEPLWELRKALRRAGIPEKNDNGTPNI